jgi:hypothetical protein
MFQRHLTSLGHWKGNTYQRYIRKDKKEKKATVKEIANTLLSKLSLQENRAARKLSV